MKGVPRSASSASTGRWIVVEQLLDLCGAEPGDRGVGAHPAGVRSLVAFVCPLEVLDDRQRERSHTVAEREDGDLLAFEELLDHDRVAEGGGRDEGAVELRLIVADEHAFAGCEAVGLDHAGRSRNRERLGRGHARVTHDVLGERLRAFDARRLTARAEDRDAGMPELVGDTGDEGPFRADHDEVGIERSCEVKEPFAVRRVNRVALAEGGDAGVARGGVQLVEARRLAQLPRERMLASARANEEHFHTWTVASAPDGFESGRECEGR